jgi:hypothetical protein
MSRWIALLAFVAVPATLAVPAVAPAATWTRAATVVRAGDSNVGAASDPQFAAGSDASGRVTVVWLGPGDNPKRIRARTIVPGESAGRIQTLGSGKRVRAPGVAVDRRGDAVAVWQQASGARGWVPYAAIRRRDGRFRDPVPLIGRGSFGTALAGAPRVAIVQGTGEAVVLWRDGRATLRAAIRPKRERFGKAQALRVGGATDLGDQDLAIAADGTAYALATSFPGATLRVAVREPAGRFGKLRALSAAGAEASQARLAVGADGTAAAIWRASGPDEPENSSPGPIVAAVRPRGGAFGSPEPVDPGDENTQPRVAVDAGGATVAAWRSGPPLLYSVRPSGGAFGAAAALLGSDSLDCNAEPAACESIAAAAFAGSTTGAIAAVRQSCPVSFGDDCTLVSRVRPSGGTFGPEAAIRGTLPARVPHLFVGSRLALAFQTGPGAIRVATLAP